jgi:hypothetical protein
VNRPEGECKHCGATRKITYRGLCWPCYKDDVTRVLYPTVMSLRRENSMIAVAVDVPGWVKVPNFGEPTTYMPGTEGKVWVMRERLESGECIFHPLDAVWG